MKRINRKEILQKLRSEGKDKKKVTHYISEKLYGEFQEACGEVPASNVIEELMRQFIS